MHQATLERRSFIVPPHVRVPADTGEKRTGQAYSVLSTVCNVHPCVLCAVPIVCTRMHTNLGQRIINTDRRIPSRFAIDNKAVQHSRVKIDL